MSEARSLPLEGIRVLDLSRLMAGRMAQKILRAVGAPELVDDPRFADSAARLANIDTLDEVIGGFVQQHTLEQNLAHFGALDVTVGPVPARRRRDD